jgi:hypothetical protein
MSDSYEATALFLRRRVLELEAERDALREAAGKVTCMACCGSGDMGEGIPCPDCPDCADLRALLNPPGNPRSGPARD